MIRTVEVQAGGVLDWSCCRLCPHECGADRTAGETGYCRAGTIPELFRHGPHSGEEPPLSGERGSGTLFFSRCTLRCLYCQNYPWSQEGAGRRYTVEELACVLGSLRDQGCHNWNLVSPTPWWPVIRKALALAVHNGERLPVVCNTSGYERPETLVALADVVDIYLTDLRYAQGESAREGSGAADYPDVARKALLEMVRLTGPMDLDEEGIARRGTICRVLILPGKADEAVASLEWLREQAGTDVAVSVMAQYTPAYKAASRAPWDRTITMAEYQKVADAMDSLGFTLGWIQEYGRPPPEGLLGYTMTPDQQPPAADGSP